MGSSSMEYFELAVKKKQRKLLKYLLRIKKLYITSLISNMIEWSTKYRFTMLSKSINRFVFKIL